MDQPKKFMKKIKRILLVGGIAFIVVLLVAVVLVGANLGSIIKLGIETVGPKITQTPITVDSVGLSILGGSASINGLTVGNPSGYVATNAIQMDKAAVTISPSSLLSPKIVVKSIVVAGPQITFEGNPFGKNNLSQILDNVKGASGGSQTTTPATSSTPATNAAPEAPSKPAPKLEVDDFLISGAKVHVQLTGILNKSLDLTLPDIHLTGLGTGPDGITPAELTQKVLSEVISSTLKAVGDAATNITNVSGKAINSTVDKIKSGLGGLFGK